MTGLEFAITVVYLRGASNRQNYTTVNIINVILVMLRHNSRRVIPTRWFIANAKFFHLPWGTDELPVLKITLHYQATIVYFRTSRDIASPTLRHRPRSIIRPVMSSWGNYNFIILERERHFVLRRHDTRKGGGEERGVRVESHSTGLTIGLKRFARCYRCVRAVHAHTYVIYVQKHAMS